MLKPIQRCHSNLTLLSLFAALHWLPANASAPTPPETVKACAACHGATGMSVAPHIPNLAGQKPAYLKSQLTAFQNGQRSHDVMSAIARQLSPAQRDALAAYFSAAVGATPAPGSAATQFGTLEFPRDYPSGFTVYLDVVEDGMRKLHLANDVAIKSIGAGKPPADGATIIVENRRKSDGAPETVAGYTAMQVGAGWGADVPELLRNGDWRYGLFSADKQPKTLPAPAECLACHKPKAAEAYVFTHAALVKKAGTASR